MANIQLSGIVTGIKGSIGGTTFQTSPNGYIARNKPIPTNRKTKRQSDLRGLNAALSQKWRTLTDAERLSWNMVAPNWPAVNKFGVPVVLSGYAVFIRANTGLWIANVAFSNTGINPAVLMTFSSPAVVISSGGGTASWSWSGGNIAADNTAVISCSRMLSPGRAYQKSFMAGLERIPATTASPFSIWNELVDKLGQPPIVGSLIWFEMQMFSTLSGNCSAPFPFPCIVGA